MNHYINSPDESAQDRVRVVGKGRWLVLPALLGTVFLLLMLLSLPSASDALAGGGANCQDTQIVSYTVQVCLQSPVEGETLTGTKAISATAEIISGEDVRVRRVTFYLNGEYLLLDNTGVEGVYHFELPTDHFVDGAYVLSATALMRDGVVSNEVTVGITLNNGVSTPPINNNQFTPYTGRTSAPEQPYVVATTGDGAGSRNEVDDVTDLVIAENPDMFIYLGDVYEKGTYTEFYNWYGTPDRKYGRFRDITNPIIGNHEYEDGEAPGYFFYWDNVPDYYSYDAGGWHFIALNSNTQFDEEEEPGMDIYDETEPGSKQYEWLVDDLENNNALCTIVYFHHPVLSVGRQGDTPRMNDMWQVMADYGVDIVLTGHDHNYQRWEPLDRDLNPNPQGITQFVHGAGGHGVQSFARTDDRVAKGFDSHDEPETLGVLRLELNATGADFSYTNIDGDPALDSGHIPCRETLPDTTPPSRPSNVIAENQNNTHVTLSWDASTSFPLNSTNTSNRHSVDNVAGYTIYRNDVLLATVTNTLRYTDTTILPDYLYLYTIDAFDSVGNHSNPSDPVELMTIPTIMLNPVADAYVRDNQNPGDDDADTPFGHEDEDPERLRTDGNPDTLSYLRFDIPDYSGHVLKATLRIYAEEEGRHGYDLSRVADNSWDEEVITYNNRPSVGEIVGSVEPFSAETWTEIDISSLIDGPGLLSVAMSSTSNTNVDYSSREGTHPPELVLRVFERLHINPVADTYVKEDQSEVNFGTAGIIRTDAYSETNSYLRFDVPTLNSEHISGTLRVYAESGGNQGYTVHDVADNSWDEESTTYNNAPTIGGPIGSVGSFVANSWTEVDVSSTITDSGLHSFALTSTSNTNTRYSSREGNNPPELLLEPMEPVISACGGLMQEAEEGVLSGNFEIDSDSTASNGQYVHVPNGAGNSFNMPDSAHQVEYCFNVETAGTYRIKGGIYADSGRDNSFFVKVDNAPSGGYLWDFPKNTTYQEDYVSNRNGADPVEVVLSAGEHTVTIFLREDGGRLDTLELELVAP